MVSKGTVFIVNPNSGNGSTGREWPFFHTKAKNRLGSFETYLTSRQGDATKIAKQSLMQGAEMIICVGGDGTLNEVINGFMNDEGPIQTDAILGFLPNGTGCDFVRTVPIRSGLDKSLDTICNGFVRSIDVGRVQYQDDQDRSCIRYFHNITSFGLGGEVVERVNRTSKALGPFVCFLWSTLLCLLLFGKKRIRYQIDDQPEQEVSCWNIAVANGQYQGGGMQVAPEASVNDGLFNITVIGDLNLAEVFWNLPKLYNGKIGKVKNVTMLKGKRVSVCSEQNVLIDMDGEQPGHLPAVIDIIPSALKIITDKF